MNEIELEQTNAEAERLLNLCDKLSTQMWNENKKGEYFKLKLLSQRISEIRHKVWLARDLLNFWDNVRGSDLECGFKSFANRHLNNLIVELNIDIFYNKSKQYDSFQFMELAFDWVNVCSFYKNYYAPKINFARCAE